MIFFQMPKIVCAMLLGSLLADSITLPKISLPLQYGALGLCAIMGVGVFKLLKDQRAEREKMAAEARRERNELVEDLREKDEQFIKVVEANTAGFNRLADALADRPCIAEDSRTKPKDPDGKG